MSRQRVDYVGPARPTDMQIGDTWDGNTMCRAAWWLQAWATERMYYGAAEEPLCFLAPEGVAPPSYATRGLDWLIGVEPARYRRAVAKFDRLLMPADGQVLPHEQPALGGLIDRQLRQGGVFL